MLWILMGYNQRNIIIQPTSRVKCMGDTNVGYPEILWFGYVRFISSNNLDHYISNYNMYHKHHLSIQTC